MAKNTGKVREFCQYGKVGTLHTDKVFMQEEKIHTFLFNAFSVLRRVDRSSYVWRINTQFWQIHNSLCVEMSQYPDTCPVVFHDNMPFRMGKHVC